jgi:hypothetical protein
LWVSNHPAGCFWGDLTQKQSKKEELRRPIFHHLFLVKHQQQIPFHVYLDLHSLGGSTAIKSQWTSDFLLGAILTMTGDYYGILEQLMV